MLGGESYEIIQTLFNSFFGKFISISLCWTFSFHILNEIRHLIWDAGYGYDLNHAYISGISVIISSLLLTSMTWLIVYLRIV